MKLQCVGCQGFFETKLTDENIRDPCPNCGEVDDLIWYHKNGYPIGINRSNREDFWERSNAVYLGCKKFLVWR